MFCYFVFCWICFLFPLSLSFDCFICSTLVFVCITWLLCLFILFKFVQFKVFRAFSIRFFPFQCCWFVGTNFHSPFSVMYVYVARCHLFQKSNSILQLYFCGQKWNAYVFLHYKNVSKWMPSNGFSCTCLMKKLQFTYLVLERWKVFFPFMFDYCSYTNSYKCMTAKKSHTL